MKAEQDFGVTQEEFANLPGRTSMEKYGNILQYQQMAYRQFENRGYREMEVPYERSRSEALRYDIPLPVRYRDIVGRSPNFDTAVREGNLDQVIYWLWRYANHAAQGGDWEVADYLGKCLQ